MTRITCSIQASQILTCSTLFKHEPIKALSNSLANSITFSIDKVPFNNVYCRSRISDRLSLGSFGPQYQTLLHSKLFTSVFVTVYNYFYFPFTQKICGISFPVLLLSNMSRGWMKYSLLRRRNENTHTESQIGNPPFFFPFLFFPLFSVSFSPLYVPLPTQFSVQGRR